MINKEIIEKNKNSYYSAIKAYNICDTTFIDTMGDLGLFLSPASTMLSLHNAFTGGLVDHLLRVTSYSLKINDILPENIKQEKISIIKVGLLHGLGKVGLYKLNQNDWSVKNQGKIYEFNSDIVSMNIGERSVYYIMKYNENNILNETEYQAILNHSKPVNDNMSEWHTDTLGEILKMGIKLSIIEEKKNG